MFRQAIQGVTLSLLLLALSCSFNLQADSITIQHNKGAITIATFQDIMMKSPESIRIIDVRDADKYARGAISGSINIPINKLEQQLDMLAGNRPGVFICASSSRSSEAYDMARLFRPELEVYYLNADIKFSRDGSYQLSLEN